MAFESSKTVPFSVVAISETICSLGMAFESSKTVPFSVVAISRRESCGINQTLKIEARVILGDDVKLDILVAGVCEET